MLEFLARKTRLRVWFDAAFFDPYLKIMDIEDEKNVLGGELEPCSFQPLTGFHRTGRCQTGPHDHGCHAVCVQVTDAFLEYSKSVGNDLSAPMEAYGFPGLKAGDRWCLCALRWKEAHEAGAAPIVILEATSEAALTHISRVVLEEFALVETD